MMRLITEYDTLENTNGIQTKLKKKSLLKNFRISQSQRMRILWKQILNYP